MSTIVCAPASCEAPVHDNTYSRVIAWLKIALPLLALALLLELVRVGTPVVNLVYRYY